MKLALRRCSQWTERTWLWLMQFYIHTDSGHPASQSKKRSKQSHMHGTVVHPHSCYWVNRILLSLSVHVSIKWIQTNWWSDGRPSFLGQRAFRFSLPGGSSMRHKARISEIFLLLTLNASAYQNDSNDSRTMKNKAGYGRADVWLLGKLVEFVIFLLLDVPFHTWNWTLNWCIANTNFPGLKPPNSTYDSKC